MQEYKIVLQEAQIVHIAQNPRYYYWWCSAPTTIPKELSTDKNIYGVSKTWTDALETIAKSIGPCIQIESGAKDEELVIHKIYKV
jgi:hypothetical protein